ncbi:ribonucleotide-diphosphate reductase subunit beta [Metabacillus sp. Hm71]|uniref:ribonucleotide-diphosphate reductase subunit beta n=1 Tax=Metabacillus sp. Hm71 TaxID=3450743 RepID=UPI003F422680
MTQEFKGKAFRIYDADSPNHPSRIFGGKASGIRSWDDIKYPIFLTYQKNLFGEFWIPEEIQMGKDMEEFRQKLNKNEQIVYAYNSGALDWLDSIATDIVGLLFLATSDPSLRTLWVLVAGFETMHNVSYEHITSSTLNKDEKDKAFNEVRNLPLLVKRNMFIIEKLEKMKDALVNFLITKYKTGKEEMDDETLQAVFEGLVAYQILEGLFFSGSFVYYHSLARDNKMQETNNIINMIKADENQHSEVFGTVIQILMSEFPQLNTSENLEFAMDFIREAVKLEKAWTAWLYQDIDTLSIVEYHDYVEYLANLICRNAGMTEPFPENDELKAKWIVTYGSKKNNNGGISPKADFLQGNAIDYKHEDGGNFDL